MIFEQIDDIIAGRKTQTRRVCKSGEEEEVVMSDTDRVFFRHDKPYVAYPVDEQRAISAVYTATGRLKWRVGNTYAVSPGRGKPCVFWNTLAPEWTDQKEGWLLIEGIWQPLHIRIAAIRQERLQDITEADARAEGWPHADIYGQSEIVPIGESMTATWHKGEPPQIWYRTLWETINTRKGTRWQDNPDVWVLTFEVVK